MQSTVRYGAVLLLFEGNTRFIEKMKIGISERWLKLIGTPETGLWRFMLGLMPYLEITVVHGPKITAQCEHNRVGNNRDQD